MKRIFLIIALFFCWSWLPAQHQSKLGRFSIAHPKGCSPLTVRVNSHDPYGNIARTYSYEQNENTTDTFHTYSAPGKYQIVQFLGADIDPKTDTLNFELLPAVDPDFEIYQCSSTEVQVDVLPDGYDYHIVRFSDTDSVVVMPGDPPPVYDYGQSNGNVEVTGHFADAYPNCGSVFRSFILSTPQPAGITSAMVNEGCEGQFFISLAVNTDDQTKYELAFQQGSGVYKAVFEGAMDSVFTYPVDFDTSQPDFCVRVTAINPCTGIRLDEDEFCGPLDPESLRPLSRAYAGYSGSAILIHLDGNESSEIIIERKPVRSADYSFLTVTSSSYLDEMTTSFGTYDYRLIQRDTCGNSVDSVQVTPPFLRIVDKNNHENTISFDASDPVNPLSDFEKKLLFYSKDSLQTLLLPFAGSLTLPALIGSVHKIRLAYEYPTENVTIYSNVVTTAYETHVFVPRAFTPNGDLLNDELELFGLPTNVFQISIYNRWGVLIHQVENLNPVWNGYLSEEKAPQGTYRYQLIFTLADGEVKTQVGTFVLLNN